MTSLRGIRRRCPFGGIWRTLYALLLGSAGHLDLLSSAQNVCGQTQTTPIRVQDADGLVTLRAALNCTGGGEVQADWAGIVSVAAPIVVLEGTFLSVTGEDAGAEVHGGGTQKRLFEVSQDGGLTLTRLKLSGGSAGSGGAVYSRSANLTLDNCVFDGNFATDGNGGAVWAKGGNVTIIGGEFLANNATRYGGAVHVAESWLVVRGNSTFDGNTATGGGAIFCGLSDVAVDKPAAVCSITGANFVSNSAAREDQDTIDDFSYLDGGGAAMFLYASVDITDSVFNGNHAGLSGGALHGGPLTNVSVSGSKFVNNTSEKYAGAISASSMTLGGGTEMTDNTATNDAGAVLGWDTDGTIIFNEVLCKANSVEDNGGCYYGLGSAIFNNGTEMQGNLANNGAGIYADDGSNVTVIGGYYSSRSNGRGGFLYAGDETRVHITGGLIENNFAGKRGGALYINGEAASEIVIEGGTFRGNKALESGGAIAVWGSPGLVTITGGTFEDNQAIFYGGFAFLEVASSIVCGGATISRNYAGDQGGGIYAREGTWVNSSCDLIANEAPQGAAIYLTNVMSATFEDHNVTDNLASGGSVVYVAASSVVARGVTFESSVGLQDYSFNRAVQLDGNTTLDAENCVFDGWRGDAVVLNLNSANGSLVLDSCDFSGSSAVLAVVSPNSDAEIRNAVVSSASFDNAVAATVNTSLTLVDRALDCDSINACGDGECVNSLLGVLCECLEGGECLHGGGELSLGIKTYPADETVYPDTVWFELMVSAASDGTTYAIWELEFDGDNLHLDVVPSSGVLPPGGTVHVSVTGTSTQEIGGNLTSNFTLKSVDDASSGSTAVHDLEVKSAFYLCKAYEYARLADDDDDAIFTCEQCSAITGEEGVDCDTPGATEALLPIQEGYWRSSAASLVVFECLHSDACVGATEVSSSDDYCAEGYRGPYCAVCTDEYGSGVGNTCHACDDTTAHVLVAMGTLFFLLVLLFLILAVVFLIGGLDAIDVFRQSVSRTIPFGSNSSASGTHAPKFSSSQGRHDSASRTASDPFSSSVAPAFALATDGKHGRGTGRRQVVFPTNFSEADESGQTYARPLGSVVGSGIELSDVTGNFPSRDGGVPARRQARFSADAGDGVGRGQENRRVGVEATGGGAKPVCCGFGDKVKRMFSRLPLDKLKILVVVWQILSVFSGITGVEFPASYSRFLSWISVVNLDIGNIFSASCLLPFANFYARLVVTTLSPLALAAVLVLTYRMAKNRAGIGRAGVIARRAAWSRHVAAGLLLTFLVFTSASTAVFKIFACDTEVVDGGSYLRADYSISCHSGLYTFFQVYAVLMILVYPIGIPVLYAAILWKNRELLNPRIHTEPNGLDETTPSVGSGSGDDNSCTPMSTSKGKTKTAYSPEELQELEEKVKARREHPELVPSMFLWKDFGPDLYYYEVIECGRRMLLTGVLIFIAPHSATQAAMACIFAFASLLGFELLRPHMDPTDSWLYRLGCVVIFLSNFLALLIKVDAGKESSRAAFGVLLVVVNIMLVLAVLVTSWFAVQQSVDDSREDETSFAIAKTMLTAERFAADSARLTRSGGVARTSAPSSSTRPNLHRSDRGAVWRGRSSSRNLYGSAGTAATSDDGMQGLARGGVVNAAALERLQHQSEGRSGEVTDGESHPTEAFSSILL